MKKTYICSGCEREYPPEDKFTCDFCWGEINAVMVNKNQTDTELNSKLSQRPEKNSLLIKCGSCSNDFSIRADKCPKCGWKGSKECIVCKTEINLDDIPCPKCGDPTPFMEGKEFSDIKYRFNGQSDLISKLFGVMSFIFCITIGLLAVGASRASLPGGNIGAGVVLIYFGILFVAFKLGIDSYRHFVPSGYKNESNQDENLE